VRTVLTLSRADPNQIGAASKILKKVIEPRIAITVGELCEVAIAQGLGDDAG
jgi:hypothetical protein